jgi:hypothetical protein
LKADRHAVAGEAGVGAGGGEAEVVAGAGEAGDAREDLGGVLAPAEVGLGDGWGGDGEDRAVQDVYFREDLIAELGEGAGAQA